MEPEGSSPHSQVPATCLYPEPARSSPFPDLYPTKLNKSARHSVAAAISDSANGRPFAQRTVSHFCAVCPAGASFSPQTQPFCLATVSGIGQGRHSLRRSVPNEPLPASQWTTPSVSVDKLYFVFFTANRLEFSACKLL